MVSVRMPKLPRACAQMDVLEQEFVRVPRSGLGTREPAHALDTLMKAGAHYIVVDGLVLYN